MKTIRCVLLLVCLSVASAAAFGHPGNKNPRGLNPQAKAELEAAGVNKYVGMFTPVVSLPVGEGWVKHTYDPAGGSCASARTLHM